MSSAQPEAPQRLTVAERQELGKSKRTQLPRSSLADYVPALDRPDPVALLESQAVTRLRKNANTNSRR